MKVREATDRARSLAGATVDESEMLGWLSDCEGRVRESLFGMAGEFEGFTDSDGERELTAKEPYAVLYVYYLSAQIYLSFADMDRYNDYIGLYADTLMDCEDSFVSRNKGKLLPQIYI